MKQWLFFILIIIFLNCCGIRKEIAVISISDIENERIMMSVEDSLTLAAIDNKTIDRLPDSLKVKLEHFINYHTVPMVQGAQYPGGKEVFQKYMMENIEENLKNRVKPGEARVKFMVNENGNSELMVLKYRDKNIKNTLQNLKLERWLPQVMFAEPVLYQFEFSVLITKKHP